MKEKYDNNQFLKHLPHELRERHQVRRHPRGDGVTLAAVVLAAALSSPAASDVAEEGQPPPLSPPCIRVCIVYPLLLANTWSAYGSWRV